MPALPDWQPFEELGAAAVGRAGGRVVGIVASEGAVAGGWAGGAALALARSWTGAGRKIMLVDGSLERPSLHLAAGVRNREGLSDVTLFGASLRRVARQIDEGGCFLVTAGTAVADPHVVVRSDRWNRLARGVVEAGVTLGLYVQDGETGAAAFLGSASEIVVLCVAGEDPPAAIRDLEGLVTLVTGSAGEMPEDVAVDDEGAASDSQISRERDPGGEPAVVGRVRKRRWKEPLMLNRPGKVWGPGRAQLVMLVVVVVVVAAVVAAFFGILEIPGLSLGAGVVAPSDPIFPARPVPVPG